MPTLPPYPSKQLPNLDTKIQRWTEPRRNIKALRVRISLVKIMTMIQRLLQLCQTGLSQRSQSLYLMDTIKVYVPLWVVERPTELVKLDKLLGLQCLEPEILLQQLTGSAVTHIIAFSCLSTTHHLNKRPVSRGSGLGLSSPY